MSYVGYIITQIIGTTSAVKGGLFRIKERLVLLGFIVRQPLSDKVIIDSEGKPCTYDPSEWSKQTVAANLIESIKNCNLHIVSNDVGGIVGRESALSIVYAMLNKKPIIVTHKPYFRPNVDKLWVKIINREFNKVNAINLLKLNNSDLKAQIEKVAKKRPRYNLSDKEKALIGKTIDSLLRLD